MSIGFGTVLASFLLAKWAIDMQWHDTSPDVLQLLAPKLLRVLRISCTYDPADNIADQLVRSLGRKIAAANRQRPSTLQMLFSFNRQIAELAAGGSRQSRTDMLSQCVKVYNQRERVRSCKIHTDEITVMKFLQRRSEEFHKHLKVTWGNDKLANTAAPMNLLASPFLDESRALPVSDKDNPTWARILTPCESKFVLWIERVQGRFAAKVDETVHKGKLPNLRSFAHMYRDQDPEGVWRSACLFYEALGAMRAALSAQRVDDLILMFKRGALDRDLLDKCKCLDPSFSLEDLRFLRVAEPEGPGVQVSEMLNNAERQKLHADFKFLEARLKAEESTWRRHVLALKSHDDTSQAELTSHRERIHDMRVQAIEEHCETLYQAESLSSSKFLCTFFERAIATFAEQPPARRPDDILRVNFFNLPMLGQHHSRFMDELAESIREECAHHPATTICVVVLPNTNQWGQGMRNNPRRDVEIDEARAEVALKLKEPVNGLTVADIFVLLRHDTMYSNDREMRAVVLLAVSNQVGADNKTLKSVFAASSAWRRRAIVEPLPVFHRQNFRDWTKKFVPFDQGNMDGAIERRQWFSGAGFLAGVLEGLFRGVITDAGVACQIRDHTLYDDQLALAVVQLNARDGRHLPLLAYAGGTWNDIGGESTALNVKVSIRERIHAAVQESRYVVPGLRNELGPEPQCLTNRPNFNAADLVLTCPRANNELPILQSVYDQWDKVASLKQERLSASLRPSAVRISCQQSVRKPVCFVRACRRQEWNHLVAEHNREFNPSGVPWKPRREAETNIEDMEENKAVTIAQPESAVASKAELVGLLRKRISNLLARCSLAHIDDMRSSVKSLPGVPGHCRPCDGDRRGGGLV